MLMRKFVALLCSLVLLFGIALCEEAPVDTPDIEIIEEPVPVEEVTEPEAAPEPEPVAEAPPEEKVIEEPIVEEEIVQEPELEAQVEEEPESEQEVIEEAESIVEEEEEEVVIDDDDEGFIDDAILPREVHITFQKEPEYFGDKTILVVTLVNFRFEDNYTIYWQYCEDPTAEEIEWKDIEGEHDQVYKFILDKTNYTYGYRVLVVVEE